MSVRSELKCDIFSIEAHKQHTGIISTFVEAAEYSGMEVICKREDEVIEEDASGVDLVVALGGDHTYLVAAQMIKDNKLPILGLNTYQGVIGEALPTHSIEFNRRSQEINSIVKKLQQTEGNIETYKRSRGKLTLNVAQGNQSKNALVLNEAFCAEKDVGSASRFRVSPDDTDWGIFKSSGIIISTGKRLRYKLFY